MGLWTNIASAFRRKSTVEEWWAEFGPSAASSGGVSVTQATALQITTVLACVSILSEDFAKLPGHVYKMRKDGGRDIQLNHPLEILLHRPNNFQSRFEFFEQMQAALLLRGNAYAAIIRDGRGKPVSFIPVNPDRVFLYEAPGGYVFYQVARRGPHDVAMLETLPLMIPADDMLHVRWMSLDNSLLGASRIGLAREAIGLALSQQELAGRMAANNTNIGGVLSTEQKLSEDAAKRLSKAWKDRKQGVRNAGETAVLEQGLKWQPIGMTGKDAEFIAGRNFQVPEIARIFRVPMHKLGVMERMAGSSVEQIDQDYVNNTISSYLERWETKLDQTFDLKEQGLFVEFDVSKFLRASLQTRYNSYRTGIVGMFLTPNEARRAEGLADVDGGDTLYQPTNVAELGFEPGANPTGTGPGSDVTGAPAAGGDGDPAAAPDESPQS